MAISSAGVAGLKPGVVDSTATRPSSPFEGQMIFQKDTDQLLVWNGSAWVIPNSPAQNPQGLELVKTQTIGSAVTSVTVSNAFSATYDNYRILVNTTGSVNQSLAITLGASVTGYYGFLIYGDAINNTVLGVGRNNQPRMDYIGGGTTSEAQTSALDVLNPFATSYTRFPSSPYMDTSSFGTMSGEHKVSASYTSFNIIATGGTMTGGTITVYGYRNS